jgi:signal transduction histidine kinase
MTPNALALSLALVLVALQGASVYWNNPGRSVNRQYGVFAGLICAWLGTNLCILASTDRAMADMWLRMAQTTSMWIPASLFGLRAAIKHPEESGRSLLRHIRGWIVAAAIVSASSWMPGFLIGIRMPGDAPGLHEVIEPVYGAMVAAHAVYLLGSALTLLALGVRDVRRADGVQRAELGFLVLGAVTAILISGTFGLALNVWLGTSRAVPLSNAIGATVLVSVIAYGIATRRIMGVGEALRRAAAWAMLVLSLALLYAGVFALGSIVTRGWALLGVHLSHLLAAMAVVTIALPAQRHLQRVANRLFGIEREGMEGAIKEATRVLLGVKRLDSLLPEFAGIARRLMRTESVRILVREGTELTQRHPSAAGAEGAAAPAGLDRRDAMIRLAAQRGGLMTVYELARSRSTAERLVATRRMADLGAEVIALIGPPAVPDGLVLLGPRGRGRLYGAEELEHLKLLCGQMAVALANARLYTETQDARAYQAILFESLGSGIIACRPGGQVSQVNREALRILDALNARTPPETIADLPGALCEPVQMTLADGGALSHVDAAAPGPGGEPLYLRCDTSPVRGHDGRDLGALLVVQDITPLRRLEQRIWRQDRLASVGTLAAGMAHEIKNPLVSLKTFVQMLPEQYDDEEFRRVFCPLIETEVRRIDAIVTGLLEFARPPVAELRPLRLHEVLRRSLQLMEPQCRRHGVTLHERLTDARDDIRGDAGLLEQSFVNLCLNALDAMNDGGRLEVETRLETGGETVVPRLRVSIADTGAGIAPEHMARIFDPFFTTKDGGTGLGLSIVYGIIQQHGGQIEVAVRPGGGTVFHLTFPPAPREGDA